MAPPPPKFDMLCPMLVQVGQFGQHVAYPEIIPPTSTATEPAVKDSNDWIRIKWQSDGSMEWVKKNTILDAVIKSGRPQRKRRTPHLASQETDKRIKQEVQKTASCGTKEIPCDAIDVSTEKTVALLLAGKGKPLPLPEYPTSQPTTPSTKHYSVRKQMKSVATQTDLIPGNTCMKPMSVVKEVPADSSPTTSKPAGIVIKKEEHNGPWNTSKEALLPPIIEPKSMVHVKDEVDPWTATGSFEC